MSELQPDRPAPTPPPLPPAACRRCAVLEARVAELEGQLRAVTMWQHHYGPPAPLDYARAVVRRPTPPPPRGAWRELYPPWVLIMFAAFVALMFLFFFASWITG